jgi:hypothetical protein
MKRWMEVISDLLNRLAHPFRPERHYMRGGRSSEAESDTGN